MKLNKYHKHLPLNHAENIAEIENKGEKHPTPEQLLLREALKTLEPKQLQIWEMWNYDRMPQDEIAKKLGYKNHSTIARQIKRIEKQLQKWVTSNLGAYKLLKSDLGEQE